MAPRDHEPEPPRPWWVWRDPAAPALITGSMGPALIPTRERDMIIICAVMSALAIAAGLTLEIVARWREWRKGSR